jgi:predicted metal-binding membrane protein
LVGLSSQDTATPILGRARRLGLFERERVSLLAVLLALAAVGWLVTDARMDGMAGSGMDLGGLGFYVTVWVVMMAAMMFPSVAPTVLLYDRLRAGGQGRPQRAPRDATALFVAGYLIVWTAAGLVAYALLEALRALDLEAFSWDHGGRYVAGGVIVVAAVYQFTPLKNACLTRCRSPLMFLAERWRDGRAGALRVGAEHGAWCVGCCWGLMVALFAVGIMSVGWMAFVAALIAVEKLLPWRRVASLGVASLLLVLGVAVALVPDQVPGLMADMADHGGGMGQMAQPMDDMGR